MGFEIFILHGRETCKPSFPRSKRFLPHSENTAAFHPLKPPTGPDWCWLCGEGIVIAGPYPRHYDRRNPPTALATQISLGKGCHANLEINRSPSFCALLYFLGYRTIIDSPVVGVVTTSTPSRFAPRMPASRPSRSHITPHLFVLRENSNLFQYRGGNFRPFAFGTVIQSKERVGYVWSPNLDPPPPPISSGICCGHSLLLFSRQGRVINRTVGGGDRIMRGVF